MGSNAMLQIYVETPLQRRRGIRHEKAFVLLPRRGRLRRKRSYPFVGKNLRQMKRFIAQAVMTALWFCYFPIAILALVFLVTTKELGYLMEKLWNKFENWMNE